MGEDFNYQSAHMWFKNLDKLIKYESGMSLTAKYFHDDESHPTPVSDMQMRARATA